MNVYVILFRIENVVCLRYRLVAPNESSGSEKSMLNFRSISLRTIGFRASSSLYLSCRRRLAGQAKSRSDIVSCSKHN